MSFYRRKPLVVEAREVTPKSVMQVAEWCGGHAYTLENNDSAYIDIETLEGVMTARLGDWIIKGVEGEFHPCKPGIFKATYESAGEDDAVTVSRRDLRAFMVRGEFAYVTEANCREIGRERQEAEIRLAKAALSK